MPLTNVPFFSQADPRWKNRLLGDNKNFQQSGCFVTAVSSLVSYDLGKLILPNELDAWLDKNKGYSGDLLIPTKVSEFVNLFGGNWPINQFERVQAKNPILRNGFPAIGRVLTHRSTTHFVVLLDEIGTIHDPGKLDGSRKSLAKEMYLLNRIYYFKD